MDIKNLTTFMHVAELHSFTKAGEKLGYSQSTISFQIRQLENELGFPLFERISHTVTLTEHGTRLLKFSHQVQAMLQDLMQAGTDPQNVQGLVRLAMADSLSVALMHRIYPALHQNYPDITLECTTAGTPELSRMLNQNEADLVYTMDSHIYNANYVILRETRIPTHFVCSPSSPLAKRDFVPLDELIQQPFLLTETGMSYRRILDENLAARSLEIKPTFVSGDTNLLCKLVSQGCGLSLLPNYVCRPMLETGALCKVQTEDDIHPVVWAQLLHHRNKWVSEAMRVVAEALCSYPL